MYKRCLISLYGIFYFGVIDIALSQQKDLEKSVNLALETVFEFDRDGKSDIQLLNQIQKFIGKVKDVIQRKNIQRRKTEPHKEKNIFTNFILNIVNVLNTFEDNDLERFFFIVNNEIQRYCDKDDDIRILNKLGLARNMPAYVLRWYLRAISNKIEEEAYYEDEKVVIDSVNDIFKQDDTTKFDQFINNLEEYRGKSRRNLVQVIQLGLWNIFLDSYYHFNPTTKIALRSILHHYIDGFKSLTTEHPASKQLNSLRRAKSKTTKESRTWRQMYVEKNLDLKYPYNYDPVTKKLKRKDKTRTQNSRFMTVLTTRATKERRQRKGKKYGKVIKHDKHIDDSDKKSNSDDEIITIKTTKRMVDNLDWKYNHNSRGSKQSKLPKRIHVTRSTKRYKQKNDRNYYKREFYQKYSEQPRQYKTSKEYGQDEDKYNPEYNNVKKLSTFYLDLEKLRASYAQQRFDTSTHEYKRPTVKPISLNIGIKHGKNWKAHQKVKKSKHYGYIQNKKRDVFSNDRQMRMKKKDPQIVNMLPSSTNVQLSMAKESSTLDSSVGDTVLEVENIYRNEDARSSLSEEGLSIEGFPEPRRKMYNRRSDNHLLNLIHELEEDLEAIKTKIIVENENNLDNIRKVTESKVNELKAGINIDESVNQVINVRKFDEERNKYDVENKKSNLKRDKKNSKGTHLFETPDEKLKFKSTGVTKEKENYNSARKMINAQKWYPVLRGREANSDEVVIQRTHAPLVITPTKQDGHDSKENSDLINNIEPFAVDSLTISDANLKSVINDGISISSVSYLKEKVINEKLENTTFIKDSPNPKVHNKEAIENTLKDKTDDHKKGTVRNIQIKFQKNDDVTLPKCDINGKLKVDKTINNKNSEENVTKQNTINEIKGSPMFRSQTKYNVTLKETITIKNYINTTSVINYNSTETAVTVNNFITTQKVIDVASKADKLKKTDFNEIARRHIEINNNNVTMAPNLNELKEISTIDSTTVEGIKNSSPEKNI